MATKYIACLGSGSDVAGSKMYRKMEQVGILLAQNDCAVVTGGFGGSGMEAPAKGAKSVNGETWGYTLLGKPANPFIDKVVDCSTFYPKFDVRAYSTEEQYGLRLGNLLYADGFIVTDDDPTPGTLVEFCAILNLQKKFWKKQKPIAIMVSERGNLKLMELIINQFFPNNTFILTTSSPEKAVGWVTA